MRYFLVVCILAGFAFAPDAGWAQKKWEDPKWDKWNYHVAPYFWYIGFKGTIFRAPVPSQLPEPPPPEWEIDVSFREMAGSIKFALMLSGEFKPARSLILYNITSLVLQGEAITPLDFLVRDLEARFSHVSGEVFGGYQLLPRNSKLDIDPLLGLKFWSSKIAFRFKVAGQLPLDGAVSKGYADPAIGMRVRYLPHPRLELTGYGDYGGSIIGKTITTQAVGGVTYRFSRLFSVFLGYRYWRLETPSDDAVFQGRFSGWMTRIGFRF